MQSCGVSGEINLFGSYSGWLWSWLVSYYYYFFPLFLQNCTFVHLIPRFATVCALSLCNSKPHISYYIFFCSDMEQSCSIVKEPVSSAHHCIFFQTVLYLNLILRLSCWTLFLHGLAEDHLRPELFLSVLRGSVKLKVFIAETLLTLVHILRLLFSLMV